MKYINSFLLFKFKFKFKFKITLNLAIKSFSALLFLDVEFKRRLEKNL